MQTDPRGWQDADGAPSSLWTGDTAAGRITAPARSDWFVDPATGSVTATAPLLLTPARGDLQLTALVSGPLHATFDAVTLFVHGDERTWAKLALERSPEGADTIVSVVTRGVSDDANGPASAVPGRSWLRISRTAEVYVFHHSADGASWSLLRIFTIGPVQGHRVGVGVQSPLGEGLTGHVGELRLTPTTLADPRDGS